jgi:hypothetical protein
MSAVLTPVHWSVFPTDRSAVIMCRSDLRGFTHPGAPMVHPVAGDLTNFGLGWLTVADGLVAQILQRKTIHVYIEKKNLHYNISNNPRICYIFT